MCVLDLGWCPFFLQSEFFELRLDGFGPDFVALLPRMEGVGHDLFSEDTVGSEEFIGNVEVVNALAGVEL